MKPTIQPNLCPVCMHIYVGSFKMAAHLPDHSVAELAEVLFDQMNQGEDSFCLACDRAVAGVFDTVSHLKTHDATELAEAIFKIGRLTEENRLRQKGKWIDPKEIVR
jgi:hypothetical protein